MAFKRVCCLLFFSLFFFSLSARAQFVEFIQQTLQINTHFRSIYGKPTWLLILRDEESGQVLPYLFDILSSDNFWVAFANERTYRVTVSKLKFSPYAAINNFCGLQDGLIVGKSMFITITGDLTPDPASFRCQIMKYRSTQFNVVQ